jgi:uncharacterized protein (DUF2147 family)
MRHHAFAAVMGIATAALLAPGSQSFAASADPTGYWMKPDAERESKIQVFKCGAAKKNLCAKIAWLKEPNDSKGNPLHDIRNENPSMRGRSIVGLAIFTGLTPSAPSTWTGKIYNPEDGHTYSATLTVLSRKQILLRGCKAWLLCGERQWLRTSAPPAEVIPEAPAGTEQIEASAEPAVPPSKPDVEPGAAIAAVAPAEAPSAAAVQPAAAIAAAAPAEAPNAVPAPQPEVQTAAAPQSMPEPQSVEPVVTKASLVTEQVAAPVPPPAEVNSRDGYGFLNVSSGPATTAHLSGDNVSSMFAMTEPIAAAPAASTTAAVQSEEPVPAPAPKPKAKPKPVATAAAADPAPKAASTAKPAGQAAPAPQDAQAAPTAADAADAPPAETAEAAMTEPVPLTRRQRRLLRKQQHEEEPFLPWLQPR